VQVLCTRRAAQDCCQTQEEEVMIFVYAIIALMVIVRGSLIVKNLATSHFEIKTYGATMSDIKKMSEPSQRIIKTYSKIPEGRRPQSNIINVLKALDTTNGIEKVNKHMGVPSGRDGYRFDWYCCGNRDEKKFPCLGYLYNSLDATARHVNEAIESQEHALRQAAVKGEYDSAKEIIDSLALERKLIEQETNAIQEMP
jgi:hypothetical protein